MAKKKKKKQEPAYEPPPQEGQYYYCVNCGHHGDYGFYRQRSVVCEMCKYDSLAMYTKEEIKEIGDENMPLSRFKKKDDMKTNAWKDELDKIKAMK